ncbi:MAG TPA: hypothetical protein VKI61_15090 [Chitinophagaceae bacterium]|jgi:hypothetical protein|nr:hypothetical protein [Chitinophagaceae bacterium]
MHKPFIIAGCTLFASAYIGEILLWQPYSTAGFIISPLLLVTGIVLWLKFYRASRGHYPRIKSIRKEAAISGSRLTLNQGYLWSHRYEFWTFWFAVVMIIIPVIGIAFNNSRAFNAITTYCNSTDSLKSRIGEIKFYGLLSSGTINDEYAKVSFVLVAEKGNFKARSLLSNNHGVWKVEKFTWNR